MCPNKSKEQETKQTENKEHKCHDDACECHSKEEKPTEINIEVEELKAKVFLLENELETLKKEQNQKILEFVEKKTKEASEIIKGKEEEIVEKYKKEYEEKAKFSSSKQITTLVDIVSQFELVINSVKNPEVANYLVGFRMFLSQFDSLLADFFVSYIVPKEGDEYDSDTMEASSTKIVDDPSFDNKITTVFKKGYKLHDRVIKLAQVEVGKIKSE